MARKRLVGYHEIPPRVSTPDRFAGIGPAQTTSYQFCDRPGGRSYREDPPLPNRRSQLATPHPGVHYTEAVIAPPADAKKIKFVDAQGIVFAWAWVSKERDDANMMASAVEFFDQHVDGPTAAASSQPSLRLLP